MAERGTPSTVGCKFQDGKSIFLVVAEKQIAVIRFDQFISLSEQKDHNIFKIFEFDIFLFHAINILSKHLLADNYTPLPSKLRLEYLIQKYSKLIDKRGN